MTGDKELPEGETSDTGGDEDVGAGGPDSERSSGAAGAKNPTCRTLGSLTVRGTRRGSIFWVGEGFGDWTRGDWGFLFLFSFSFSFLIPLFSGCFYWRGGESRFQRGITVGMVTGKKSALCVVV